MAGESAGSGVVRFEVEERVLFAGGREWGSAGAYERLRGTAHMEADPGHAANACIVNLGKAPRNERGMVEFSTPFLILKPVDMRRGNGKVWHCISNRGMSLEIALQAFPPPPGFTCDPLTAADVGESNVLLHEGYAIVDAGWHGDGVPHPALLYPTFPVAKEPDGSPIVGPLRLEYTPEAATFSLPLAHRPAPDPGWRAYEAADTDTAHASLTVRDRVDGPKLPIPADRWAFGRWPDGAESFEPATTDVCLFDGFEPDRIYELTYTAKDPIVMGLAYAVTRDLASFLRNRTHDDAGNANPLARSATEVGIRRIYASGRSTAGMYLRDFLHLGFNADLSRRRVFDGVTISVAGTHRLFANVQFAHPTFYSGQEQHHDFTSNAIAPLTLGVSKDPVSGARDGILKRPATDPLVFLIDGETEFWQFKASLNVVDGRGEPVPVPDDVRLYFHDGFGHIWGAAGLLCDPLPAPGARHPVQASLGSTNPTQRALAIAMDAWADRGVAPPESSYPGLEPGTLVSLDAYRAAFPAMPGVEPPSVLNELAVLDFGPSFDAEGGVQTVLPPVRGDRYEVLVPAPDPDGVGRAGIRTVFTRAPLGTNVGWNVCAGSRAPDLFGLFGSYVPFAVTRAERLANGDPRLSLQERYGDHDGFVAAVRDAANGLVRERFLLAEDAETFVRAAEASGVLQD